MQSAEHPEGMLGQQHNQTIMITGTQPQSQQTPQTPPIQQVNFSILSLQNYLQILSESKISFFD